MSEQVMKIPTMPAGLSPLSQGVWGDLLGQHHFERQELEALAQALKWQDVSAGLLAHAEAATEPDRSKLFKLAMDAATCSLRFWRVLKFTDGAGARRPGRPSDDNWSQQRKLQKLR
jgi:hypothetical protein